MYLDSVFAHQNYIPALVDKALNSTMARCHSVVAQHHYIQTMAFRRSSSLCCSLEQK